jgi:hypothetical protein
MLERMPPSTQPTRESGLRIRVAPEELSLIDWPLVQQPLSSAVALFLAGGASGLAGWAARSWIVTAFVAVLMCVALVRTLLPIRYTLGGGGIVQSLWRWRRRIPWTAIRDWELHADGVLLLPEAVQSPLRPLRGVYLHWGQYKAAVLAHLDYHLGAGR